MICRGVDHGRPADDEAADLRLSEGHCLLSAGSERHFGAIAVADAYRVWTAARRRKLSETTGKAAGRMTMVAVTAPLLKIERWPDINRAAVGDRCSSETRRVLHARWGLLALFHSREPLRTSLRHIVLSAEVESRESAGMARPSRPLLGRCCVFGSQSARAVVWCGHWHTARSTATFEALRWHVG